jgi:hypothetical protein
LNKIKTEYGIKCEAYSIIDTVNNQYLQNNEKLRNENKRLREENEELQRNAKKLRLRQELRSQKFVDLTNEDDAAYDSDVEYVASNAKGGEVIEIKDDDSEQKLPESDQNINDDLKDNSEHFDELKKYWDSWMIAQK